MATVHAPEDMPGEVRVDFAPGMALVFTDGVARYLGDPPEPFRSILVEAGCRIEADAE